MTTRGRGVNTCVVVEGATFVWLLKIETRNGYKVPCQRARGIVNPTAERLTRAVDASSAGVFVETAGGGLSSVT